MKLLLRRRKSKMGATIGELSVDGVFVCFTLEDEIREIEGQPVENWKVSGKTAIPCGEYNVSLELSKRFGQDTLTVNNVPGFQYIRMHAGNTSADTEGCPLLGMQVTDTTIIGGTSRPAVALVKGLVQNAIARKELVTIEVKNP